jgi:hypothetical protein
MVELQQLWLPILLSAVFMFIASAIIHMAPLWHKSDYPALPNQDKVQELLRPLNIPPGEYMLPRGDCHADMKKPEFVEKLTKGPIMLMTVYPNGVPKMGAQLVQWFIYGLIVSVFAAYISGRALAPGEHYLTVFRFAGTTAFLGYVMALWQIAIWYKRSISVTIKDSFDGLIYALLTAGVFGWLWPQ